MASTVLIALGTIVLLARAPVIPGQAVPGQAPAAVPSPEEAARLRLEAHLKELQRRLEFDNPDLPARYGLLKSIIDDCIELERDYAPYQAKLKEAEAELKKQADAETKRQRNQRANAILKSQAADAMRRVPPDWSKAADALTQALVLVPTDPETLSMKARVDAKRREELVYRGVLGSLLTVTLAGAGFAAFTVLRKRGARGASSSRRLEMLEGPTPGETFPLEKDITTVGAVAVECDWVIADPSRRISRRHCDIARSGKHFFLTDYSSNGTFVNGKRVAKGEPRLLRKGDRIALSEDILLRFR